MSPEYTTSALVAALVAAIVSMQWFLLREVRAAMNGLSREISDLVVTIAMDVATRPNANGTTRELARRMVRERDPVREREIESGRDR